MNHGGPGSVPPPVMPHGGQPSPMMMMPSPLHSNNSGYMENMTPQPMTPHQQQGPPSVGPPIMMAAHSPMPSGPMPQQQQQQPPMSGMMGHVGPSPQPHQQQMLTMHSGVDRRAQHLPPPQMQSQVPQQQLLTFKEMSPSYLCRLGAEFVQEIVARTQELFSFLKTLGININNQNLEDRKAKIRDLMKIVDIQFGKLRSIYERIEEVCAPYDNIDIDALLGLSIKDENNELKKEEEETLEVTTIEDGEEKLKIKTEEENNSSCEKISVAKPMSTVTPVVRLNDEHRRAHPKLKKLEEEYTDLVALNKLKHRQMKEVIDRLRQLVWDINTMLAVRKP